MLKVAGYLKKSDINVQLEARLRELVAIKQAEMPVNQRAILLGQAEDAYNKRYNTKSALNDSSSKTPTPSDSFIHNSKDPSEDLDDETMPEPVHQPGDE